jgi:hypothetical protein
MLGFVISVVVSTGVVLVTTATTVVTSVVMNMTMTTARLGYAYIRDQWNKQPKDQEKKEESLNLTRANMVNSSLPIVQFHDSSEEALCHNLKE